MIKKPAFIGYITAGDGGLDYCVDSALALIEGGVDLLELGIPFSDPVADGPVIARAMERALQRGTTPEDVLTLVEKLRSHTNIPLILMSYYNPLYRAGKEYLERAKARGVNGLLIVDLPPEEKIPTPLPQIFLMGPSTTGERMQKIAAASESFIYYVCQKGTTGMRSALPEGFAEKIAEIKTHTTRPVVAGFGIASKEAAREALQHADGFVVGSLFVDAMEQQLAPEKIRELAKNIDPRQTGERP